MRTNPAINKVLSGKDIQIIESARWPITDTSRHVHVLKHEPTGEYVAWIRGPMKCFGAESITRISIRECFGAGACEKCVYECCTGRLVGDAGITHADFEMRYMGTARMRAVTFTEVPLCGVCYNNALHTTKTKYEMLCDRINQQRERFCDQFSERAETI